MMEISGQVAFNATDSTPQLHTTHGDGRFSISFTDRPACLAVYVRGTAAELSDLVDRLGRAVIDAQRAERVAVTA